jgi:hypothetical protein
MCKLLCCVKDCGQDVKGFVAKKTCEMMIAKNQDLAGHEALCPKCHRKLELDQEVEYLTMTNGKRRNRTYTGNKDSKNKDNKQESDRKPKITMNGKVNAIMELLENSFGSSLGLGNINTASVGTQPVAAPTIPAKPTPTPTTSFADRMTQLRQRNDAGASSSVSSFSFSQGMPATTQSSTNLQDVEKYIREHPEYNPNVIAAVRTSATVNK